MKCKYCDADLVEGKPFCPSCGKSQEEVQEEAPVAEMPEMEAPAAEASAEEKTEAKEGVKAAPGKIAAAVVAVVVVLAVLIAVIISGMSGGTPDAESTEGATEPVETAEPTHPADGNPDDETCKGTYTVSEADLLSAKDTVVARIAGEELTVSELQIFYWAEVYSVLEQYGDYISLIGLNPEQSLDTQVCTQSENGITWQQYFLASALNNWHTYQSLALESKAVGYEPEADYLEYLANLPQSLEENAVSYGYANTAEHVATLVGPATTAEEYIDYITLNNDGYLYFNVQYEHFMTLEDEIKAYFAENESLYAENGITKDSGKYVDVRHILLMPEDANATTDESGYPVYSQEAWDACLVEAQKVYDEWKTGDMTEESFAQFAMNYSVDGSASSGGLYTDVQKGQMVENFENWCFDEARVEGDHGLVQTQYGYHIMYFVDSRDIWYASAMYDYAAEKSSEMVSEVMEKYAMEVDYSTIVLGHIDPVNGG